MPEISRFFGIVIRMFVEAGAPHHRPHLHAQHGEHRAVVAIDTVELLAGDLPLRSRRLVLAWTEIHHGELLENWGRLREHRLPVRIEPLR